MGITAETVKHLIMDAGAVYVDYDGAARLIGATAGGNTFTVEREVREIEVDGAKGKVKGLRRVITENATLVVRLKEITTENLVLALAGAAAASPTTTTRVEGEYLGEGSAAADTFTANNAPIVGTERFWVDGVRVNWVLGVDYAIVGTSIETLAVGTIGVGEDLVISYRWDSAGAATHDIITSDAEIAIGDYLTDVALVATVSGAAGTPPEPVVILVKNALGDGNLEANFADKDETVIELTLSAHYNPADLSEPIYEIRFPKIA